MEKNHIFSFPGGDQLAKMAAWWFVSYSYYLYIDKSHFSWNKSKTASTRRSVYERTKEYHVYWLTEILCMKNLDVHKNAGGLHSDEIKAMAKELLALRSKDEGRSEIQALINSLQKQLQSK